MECCNRLAVMLLAFCILISGCSSEDGGQDAGTGGEPKPGPEPGGTLIIGLQQEPDILNEAISSMVSGIYVCNLIFSKFVKHNDRMELVPDLITEIPTLENGGISRDHLTYRYSLRKDAFWHDGVPVTSADVKFTAELMLDPDINVGTRQGWNVIDTVETPDSHTVVFKLREVYTNFTGDCFYDESVLPRHLLEDDAGEGFIGADFHKHPVGSGPFIFSGWKAGSHIELEANRDYYGEGPHLERIIIRFILESNSLVMQLESGEIMGADNIPGNMLDIVSSIKGMRVYKTPALFLEHLDVNCRRSPLDDSRVRRAISMAIDRKEISEKIYDGIWVPAYSDEHPDSPYHTGAGLKYNAFDPQRAGDLLSRAGWRDLDGDGIREKDGKRLTIGISTTTGRTNRERTESVLARQLRDIGIDLRIKNYHPGMMFAGYDDRGILSGGNYDLALYAFMAPPDPSTKETSYSGKFIPPFGQNYSGYSNDTLTSLLSMGSSTVSQAKREELYSEIMEILARELPVIPLLWITQIDAMPVALKDYRPNPTQSGDTWNANEWRLDRGSPGR